jgi:hypothetical protein
MTVAATLAILRRRWPVLALGLVLVVTASLAAGRSKLPLYSAKATMLFTPPRLSPDAALDAQDPNAVNPYLADASKLDAALRVTALAVTSQASVARLQPQGATSIYTVGPGPEVTQQTLVIDARDRDPESAKRTAGIVMTAIEQDLSQRQVQLGVAARDRIQVVRLGDIEVTTVPQSAGRLIVLIAAGGVAASVMAAFALERWKRRRDASPLTEGGAGRLQPGVAWRRWYIFLPVAVVLLGAALSTAKRAPRLYQAGTSMFLIPPTSARPVAPPPGSDDPTVPAGTANALLSLTDSLSVMAQSIATNVMAPAAEADLRSRGARGDYEIVYWRQSNNAYTTDLNPTPVLLISATAASPDDASHTASMVSDQLRAELAGLQASLGAPKGTLIQASPVTQVQVVQLRVSKARAVAALGVLALAGALVLTRLADAVMIRRRRRHRPPNHHHGRLSGMTDVAW